MYDVMRAALARDVDPRSRRALLLEHAKELGWTLREWPIWLGKLTGGRISTTIPIFKTIYLRRGAMADPARHLVPLVIHELAHAVRSIAYGRWKWMMRYGAGISGLYVVPVLVAIALLALIWSSTAAAVIGGLAGAWVGILGMPLPGLGVAPGLLWGWSEQFRRAEEVEGEGWEAAARVRMRLSHSVIHAIQLGDVRADSLHSNQHPYWVRGGKTALYADVARRGEEIIGAEQDTVSA